MRIAQSLTAWLERVALPSARDLALSPGDSVSLGGEPVRVRVHDAPLEIRLGSVCLLLVREARLGDGASDLLLVDRERLEQGIYPLKRLAPGDRFEIDPDDPSQRQLFARADEALRHRLQLRHEGDTLWLRERLVDRAASLARFAHGQADPLELSRSAAHKTIRDMCGGQIETLLPPDTALQLIREVTDLLATDPYLVADPQGGPSALLELPDGVTPILLGDLHGRPENLLSVLVRNGFLAAIAREDAALVVLGDVVHREDDAALEDMSSSLLIMDLLFTLKRRFPRGVHMILGNHDSFSTEVVKGGVVQGPLWERELVSLRGAAYRDAMRDVYDRLPLIMRSANCCACHAGPPRIAVDSDTLIAARRHPKLMHEITWNRPSVRGRMDGYTARDVVRFRAALGLGKQAPMVTAHHPRSHDATVWIDADNIQGHYVVFSARGDNVGVVVRLAEEVVALTYPVEPLSAFASDSCSPVPVNSLGRPPNASLT